MGSKVQVISPEERSAISASHERMVSQAAISLNFSLPSDPTSSAAAPAGAQSTPVEVARADSVAININGLVPAALDLKRSGSDNSGHSATHNQSPATTHRSGSGNNSSRESTVINIDERMVLNNPNINIPASRVSTAALPTIAQMAVGEVPKEWGLDYLIRFQIPDPRDEEPEAEPPRRRFPCCCRRQVLPPAPLKCFPFPKETCEEFLRLQTDVKAAAQVYKLYGISGVGGAAQGPLSVAAASSNSLWVIISTIASSFVSGAGAIYGIWASVKLDAKKNSAKSDIEKLIKRQKEQYTKVASHLLARWVHATPMYGRSRKFTLSELTASGIDAAERAIREAERKSIRHSIDTQLKPKLDFLEHEMRKYLTDSEDIKDILKPLNDAIALIDGRGSFIERVQDNEMLARYTAMRDYSEMEINERLTGNGAAAAPGLGLISSPSQGAGDAREVSLDNGDGKEDHKMENTNSRNSPEDDGRSLGDLSATGPRHRRHYSMNPDSNVPVPQFLQWDIYDDEERGQRTDGKRRSMPNISSPRVAASAASAASPSSSGAGVLRKRKSSDAPQPSQTIPLPASAFPPSMSRSPTIDLGQNSASGLRVNIGSRPAGLGMPGVSDIATPPMSPAHQQQLSGPGELVLPVQPTLQPPEAPRQRRSMPVNLPPLNNLRAPVDIPSLSAAPSDLSAAAIDIFKTEVSNPVPDSDHS